MQITEINETGFKALMKTCTNRYDLYLKAFKEDSTTERVEKGDLLGMVTIDIRGGLNFLAPMYENTGFRCTGFEFTDEGTYVCFEYFGHQGEIVKQTIDSELFHVTTMIIIKGDEVVSLIGFNLLPNGGNTKL